MLPNIIILSRQSYIFKKRHIRDALQVVSKIKEISQKKNVKVQCARHDRAKLVTKQSSLLSQNLLEYFKDKENICDVITPSIHINSRR